MIHMPQLIIDCRGKRLDCRPGHGPHVMGILNVTPDSFSDGGDYLDLDASLRRVEEMAEQGASIIDIGGESTRPTGAAYGKGAAAVDEGEELRRTLPVVQAVARQFPDLIISIDTYKPVVAAEALDAGAHIINDVTGLRLYPETARIAADAGAALVVMHSLGTPGSLPHDHRYVDVVGDVKASLAASVRVAEEAGVESIVVDAGFGFGKSTEDNLAIIRHTDTFSKLGRPVLVGISRKTTIGRMLGSEENPRPVQDRLFGTLGATAVAVLRGASIVRTHDVRETSDFLAVLKAVAHERTS